MMANSIQGNPKKKSKRSMIVILILLLILAALVVLIWTTYSAMLREYQAAREAIANAPVQTAVVERGDLSEAIDDLTGTLRSKQSVSLYWKAAGTVGSVDVALGDKVEKGQVLAELDEGTISSTINEAAVTKEKKEKELDNLITTDLALATAYNKMITAKKAIDTAQDAIHALRLARKNTTELNTYYQDYLNAQAQYQEALASFEELKDRPVDDFDRQMAASMVDGAKSGVASAEAKYNWYNGEADPLELKKAEATLKLREAEYEDAVRDYEKIMNGPTADQIRSLEAEINAAAATMKTAQIIAPITGVITEVKAAPLDVIQANAAGIVNETLAIRMDDLSSYYVDVDVHENKINAIQLGQKVELTFDAVPFETFTGTISNFSTVGTVTNNVVKYSVTVKLDGVSPELKPGMVADLKIITDEYNDVLTVPATAVGMNMNGESVVAVQDADGLFTDVVVTVGYSNGKETEISSQSGGISEGTIVRRDYISGLIPGFGGPAVPSLFGWPLPGFASDQGAPEIPMSAGFVASGDMIPGGGAPAEMNGAVMPQDAVPENMAPENMASEDMAAGAEGPMSAGPGAEAEAPMTAEPGAEAEAPADSPAN